MFNVIQKKIDKNLESFKNFDWDNKSERSCSFGKQSNNNSDYDCEKPIKVADCNYNQPIFDLGKGVGPEDCGIKACEEPKNQICCEPTDCGIKTCFDSPIQNNCGQLDCGIKSCFDPPIPIACGPTNCGINSCFDPPILNNCGPLSIPITPPACICDKPPCFDPVCPEIFCPKSVDPPSCPFKLTFPDCDCSKKDENKCDPFKIPDIDPEKTTFADCSKAFDTNSFDPEKGC